MSRRPRRLCAGPHSAAPACPRVAPPGRLRCGQCETQRIALIGSNPYRHPTYLANSAIVRRNAGPNCPRCGTVYSRTNPLTIEHITPLDLGGTHDLENLTDLCRSCNAQLGARIRQGQLRR